MQVSELMTTEPVTVAPDESILAVIELMRDMTIRHVPVVNDEDDLVGMISDRDVRPLLRANLGESEEDMPRPNLGGAVSSLMSGAPLSVDMESDGAAAAELMIEHRVGAVPVVDGDGALVGIVSYVDLLRHYIELSGR